MLKFCERVKVLKFGSKKCLIMIFLDYNFKNYSDIWRHHPQIFQTWAFNSYSVFWYKVRFFKDPGSAFSEGHGAGSNLFYKECLLLQQKI